MTSELPAEDLTRLIRSALPIAKVMIDPNGNAASLLADGYRVNLSGGEYDDLAHFAAMATEEWLLNTDHHRALLYFNLEVEPRLRSEKVPPFEIEWQRLNYILAVSKDPDATSRLERWQAHASPLIHPSGGDPGPSEAPSASQPTPE